MKVLHVNGALQVVNELNVGGTASTEGSAGVAGQVLKSNGPGNAPTRQSIAGVPNSTGTVIVVNGQFLVAQEIIVQMTNDFTVIGGSNGGIPVAIGSLNNEIVDNENQYTGSAAGNSFRVYADGVYQVTMDAQLSTVNGSFRLYNTDNVTIKYLSSGTTGSGPVTQMSLRRLK